MMAVTRCSKIRGASFGGEPTSIPGKDKHVVEDIKCRSHKIENNDLRQASSGVPLEFLVLRLSFWRMIVAFERVIPQFSREALYLRKLR